MQYLAWRVMCGLNRRIEISFLLVGSFSSPISGGEDQVLPSSPRKHLAQPMSGCIAIPGRRCSPSWPRTIWAGSPTPANCHLQFHPQDYHWRYLFDKIRDFVPDPHRHRVPTSFSPNHTYDGHTLSCGHTPPSTPSIQQATPPSYLVAIPSSRLLRPET